MPGLWRPELGALPVGEKSYRFTVWAPKAEGVQLHLLQPEEKCLPMERDERGYHRLEVDGIEPGATYFYRLGDKDRPDPASRFQPQDVHGPSQVVTRDFAWSDQLWHGIPLPEYIIYEMHVGTFTPEGTFDAAISYLDELLDLGVTALEIMPVGQFPGNRNWGYDGVAPYAVQSSYGGPEGLKRLVNACHQRDLAIILDVVYNHLGAEGNYLWDYGPYFTERYHTPWGAALNFDGPMSDEVRRYFIENALYWITEFHIDALRLDATHAYMDLTAMPFLEELAFQVHRQGETLHRFVHLIAENDRSDARVITPREQGGYGIDAQWSDDLHHAIHTLLTQENMGYYQDFGLFEHLFKAMRDGWYYSGDYSPARQRRHGSPARHLPGWRFVVCTQNHDQIGNRMLGERLSQLVSFEALKLAAGVVLLSPYLPLLFMGEEYGETAPFQYFISHTDPELVRVVQKGRAEEFAVFSWKGEAPDPFAEGTFQQSKLNHNLRQEERHAQLLALYRQLIRLRKTLPPLYTLNKDQMDLVGYAASSVLYMRRWEGSNNLFIAFHFDTASASITLPVPGGTWHKLIDSTEAMWGGQSSEGSPQILVSEGELTLTIGPQAFIVYLKRN